MSRTLLFVVLIPRNICVLVLRTYRAIISPLYGDVCRFYPSCSSYALGAIQHYGVLRGVLLGIRRLSRCHPWSAGGVDDVPERSTPKYAITRFGFVHQGSQDAYSSNIDLIHSRGKG